jgi:DNA-directed RNA polymerase specialized sigma subunit
MIELSNQLTRASRQMLHEIGREPTPEELAAKLGMPLEKLRKVLKITKEPISLESRRDVVARILTLLSLLNNPFSLGIGLPAKIAIADSP